MNEIEKVLQKLRDTKALEFGVGALKKVPSMFEKFFPGKTAVVVADKITYDIAGETVYNCLRDAGIRTEQSFIFTDPGLYAEWTYLEQLESYLKERDAIAVAVDAAGFQSPGQEILDSRNRSVNGWLYCIWRVHYISWQ